MNRQIPKWSELRQLLQFKPIDLNRQRARLNSAADIWDLRAIAKRRTPRAPFDYVDGAANQEISLRRAREAYAAVEFQPRVLRDVSAVDLTTPIAGGVSALPFGIAPTGFTRVIHPDGETAGVQAAHAAGIPFSLSTVGTTDIETVAKAGPDGRRWFQLYLWRQRERSLDLIERAAAAGYDTLMVTVDTPVAGARLRDMRNGMSIPPTFTWKTVADTAYRPYWWLNFLTTEPPKFASLTGYGGELADLINALYDPALSFDDLRWLRDAWKGQLFVKGVQSPEDAARIMDLGADGVVISSHGGRQLDRAPVPFLSLPAIRKAVGDKAQLIVDSGIMTGGDIVAAIAAGADFTLVGRAYLYGLMAGGRAGVDRAIQILRKEITVAMQLLGVSSVQELNPEHIRMNWRERT